MESTVIGVAAITAHAMRRPVEAPPGSRLGDPGPDASGIEV